MNSSPPPTVPYLVLDTNVLGRRRPFRGSAHRVLLEAHRRGLVRIVLLPIVVEEAIAGWARRISEQADGLLRIVDELKASGVCKGKVRVSRVEIEMELSELQKELDALIARFDLVQPAWPKTSHREIAKRAISRRQPFDQAGKDGYRDTLIWESVLSLLDSGDNIILISADAKAFGDPRDRRRLADGLCDEVKARARGSAQVVLLASIAQAIDYLELTVSEAAEAAAAALAHVVDLAETLSNAVLQKSVPIETEFFADELPGLKSASLLMVLSVGSAFVVSAARRENGLLDTELVVRVEGLAVSSFDEVRDLRHPAIREASIGSGSPLITARLALEAELTVRVVLDPASDRIVDLHAGEIESISFASNG